jgi:hypothetical protein
MAHGMRTLALLGLVAAVLAAGCGGGSQGTARVYEASTVRAYLESKGVTVLESDPAFVVGDTLGGTFQVGVGDNYADVAFGANESKAAETEKLARSMLESFGAEGDARYHGNVAYWALDESNDPVDAVEQCLQ